MGTRQDAQERIIWTDRRFRECCRMPTYSYAPQPIRLDLLADDDPLT